jgi:HlyD family secretion protein
VEVGIEVSGTIKTVEVDYNDQVKVGQVLARLDTSKLEAQALQSEASLESARASVQEAEAQLARLNRVHELSDGKMPSQSDLDTAKATLARAKASVTQWQATLDVNRTDLSKAVIHSPINGVVLTRSVEPGQTVAAAFQAPVLFTLAEDLRQMELQVDIDEADVGQVRESQEATFTVDAYPDRTFPARITQVRYGSQTVEGVVTYKTVLTVDNSNLLLRPGMTATAVITVEKKDNVLLVPNAALRFTPPPTQTASKSSGGSLVGALLPRPPKSESTPKEDTNGKSKEQRAWTLRNGQLTAIAVTKGVTDGVMTEITGGAVETGMELITDVVTTQ